MLTITKSSIFGKHNKLIFQQVSRLKPIKYSNYNNFIHKLNTRNMTVTPYESYKTDLTMTKEEYFTKIEEALKRSKDHLKSLNYPGSKAVLKYESQYPNPPSPTDKVFFFDIDNCLYKRSLQIHDLMQIYIHDYFMYNLEISDDEAHELRERYYKSYGLAIQGLVKYHKIDAIEYNEKVDDALPLQDILKPDLELRKLLIKLRESGKVDRLWLFTNAYKNHAKRVISLLGIGDLFDGLTYCDYTQLDLICKPNPKMFEKAMKEAGVTNYQNCYFIDDSNSNIKTSVQLGFKESIHFIERDQDVSQHVKGSLLIRDILDLPKLLPDLFN